MKNMVEYLNSKNIICKRLKEVLPKALGSRKRVAIFVGVNLKGYYCSIITIKKRSRILKKEVLEIMLLHEKLEIYADTKIKKRYIYIDAPLCKEAKALFVNNGWIVWDKA
ncbi:hypothetical protein MNB_SV-6-954 [hydrothermal vent metagenome]|uniref:Uncharacterized protein n=1 Tax=hydrothermal vent metagenome TaxID=652676 RepID=A0A1W1C6B3_9ZZZZ